MNNNIRLIEKSLMLYEKKSLLPPGTVLISSGNKNKNQIMKIESTFYKVRVAW